MLSVPGPGLGVTGRARAHLPSSSLYRVQLEETAASRKIKARRRSIATPRLVSTCFWSKLDLGGSLWVFEVWAEAVQSVQRSYL